MAEPLPGWARDLLLAARIGHFATCGADPTAPPHVVPVCFAFRDDALYIAIDEKPKSGRRLQRLRDIAATGSATLLVDHYAEDWSQLAWVQARCHADILPADAPAHAPAVAALRSKYVQYRSMTLETAELIELRAERWLVWRAADGGDAQRRT